MDIDKPSRDLESKIVEYESTGNYDQAKKILNQILWKALMLKKLREILQSTHETLSKIFLTDLI